MIENLEKNILPADAELSKQLRDAKMLDKEGKLVNGSAAALMSNPQIRGVIELLGEREMDRAEGFGFSMGDLNPGNVMAYKNGGLEFVDFENCKLAQATSLLFPRWVRAGVYGPDGSAVKVGETDAEERLLSESYEHYKRLTIDGMNSGMSQSRFRAGFQKHKTAFLLQIARRYKKYEKIDADPNRMRALKRYYYSWFVKELEKQGKVNGADDNRLDYLNRLFEKPLLKDEMVRVFEKSDPAFSYRSELSPVTENLEKKIQEDRKKTVDDYRRKKTLKQILKAAAVGAAGAAILYFGWTAYRAEKRSEEFRQKIERIEIALKDNESRLKRGQEEQNINQSYESVKRYYMFRTPVEATDFLADHRINAWMQIFYPGMDESTIRLGGHFDPKYKEDRLKHPEWNGFMLTALAAEIDWETLKEGLLATHCTDWQCELGEWFEKKSRETIDTRVKEFRAKHPDNDNLPSSLVHERYGTLNSMISGLHYVGVVDNWARFPDVWGSSDRAKVKNKTDFMRTHHFGTGHHCKGYNGKIPDDMEPDYFGWPGKKRQ